MTKITSDTSGMRDILEHRLGSELDKAKWYFSLIGQGNLLWTNTPDKVWCRILGQLNFTANAKWNYETKTFNIEIKSHQTSTIDEINIMAYKRGKKLYTRSEKIASITLHPQDSLNITVSFTVLGEVR